MSRGLRNSVVYRLTLWVWLFTGLVVGLALAGFMYRSYRHELISIEENAAEIERIHVPQLTSAVWDYAEDHIATQVEGLRSIRHVSYVELTTEEGITRAGERLEGGVVTRQYTLVHLLGGRLGTLVVQFNLASAREAVLAQKLELALYVILPFGVFALVTLFAFRSIVTRHLDALAEYSRELTVDTLGRSFHFDRRANRREDELDRLANAIDTMRANLLYEMRERKTAEAELRQLQKLESIGQLAGGIAHDFNNLLTGIMGAAELLSLSEDEAVKDRAAMILTTAERAANLTSKLLTFSRKGKIASVNVEVHGVIRDVVSILQRSIDKRIVIEARLAANRSWVVGDPTQIQSSILNVALNARDALPEGGQIVIATDNVALTERDCSTGTFSLTPGDYLDLTIRDAGVGMTEDVLAHVFEPFFTTKEVGKGTGLGLAAVYGAMKDHKGAVTIESEVGVGTTCHLLIPAGAGEDHPVHTIEARHGTGRILLIDDEELVRLTTSRRLALLGYDVIEASDGVDGVARYREHGDEIDLVIVDMIMPRMNGAETIHAIRAIDDQARFLIASGFAPDDSVQKLLGEEAVVGFLQKPFRHADLGEVVASALGCPLDPPR